VNGYTRRITHRSSRPRGRRPGVAIDPEALRRARLEAGLTLSQVGGGELTRQAVHLYESGRASPSARSLRIIAGRLRVPVESLLRPPAGAARAVLPDRWYEDDLTAGRLDEAMGRAWATLTDDGAMPAARAVAHHYLGRTLCQLVRPDEALDHLRLARALGEAIGDRGLVAESLEWEASALHARDDPAAMAVGQEALDRYRAIEGRQPQTEARMLERLAAFLVRRKAYDRAERCYEDALELAGPVRDLTLMARIYHGLSHCLWSRGERRRAIELAQMSVSLYSVQSRFVPFAARISLPRAENDLGTLLLRQGQLDRAEECLTSALDHFAATADDPTRGHVLLSLAELRDRQGRRPEARELLDRAIDLGQQLEEKTTLAAALQQLAELQAAEGEYADAERAFDRALTILEGANLQERRLDCLAARARMQEALEHSDPLRARTS
jgi:tetratricopeptide (TPR) repeat protein